MRMKMRTSGTPVGGEDVDFPRHQSLRSFVEG